MLVFPSISCMKWPVTPHAYRRWKDGTPYHCRADAIENRLGGPTPTGRYYANRVTTSCITASL
jgi:hypothetical protein